MTAEAAGVPAAPLAWSDLAWAAPEGLAVVDADRRFVQLNAAAGLLCQRPVVELTGAFAPFELSGRLPVDTLGLLDDGAAEQACVWEPTPGVRREFAYRTRPLPGDPTRTIVAFRDVTAERQRQRRVAAIARSSAKLATEGSITATLDALAQEVLRADALAGVQILTLDDSSDGLRIMGSAGFRHWPDFFSRLMECRRRGAALKMIDAFERLEPVVVPSRWTVIQRDRAWEPLHDYLAELPWDWFASVPLLIRGRAAGILNAFFAPGQAVGPRAVEFLQAMADQAAIAVGYAGLLVNERELARRDERQRLARDLHDSVVQQVFSIGMQAKSMEVLGARSDVVPAESVRRIADEVGVLVKTVLTDLRALVHELRPRSLTELGLQEAVRALGESTTNRTGLRISLVVGRGVEFLTSEMTEDVYRIVAEAIHNVVKHSDASRVTIRMSIRGRTVAVSVTDNGRGIGALRHTGPEHRGGDGLTTMRERAARWGGTVEIGPGARSGTAVRATIPLQFLVPRAGGDRSARREPEETT